MLKMIEIKNTIIRSLIKNNLINSKEDILSIEHINKGLINYIFLIRLKNKDLVAKYAADFCRFSPNIKIDKNRLDIEYRAITLWKSLTKKNYFPSVEYYDKEANILFFEKIPESYRLLDCDLFSGIVDLNLPKKLGRFLAELHNSTAYNKDIQAQFSNTKMMQEFKLPAIYENITYDILLKRKIKKLENSLLKNKVCLVHADFKPINMFYNAKDFILIDYEQAHYGNPALDVCYTPVIYLLAMANNPSKSDDYYYCIESFWDAYKNKSELKELKILEENSLKHLGVNILSRTFGITKINTLQKPAIRRFVNILSQKLISGEIASFYSLKSKSSKII